MPPDARSFTRNPVGGTEGTGISSQTWMVSYCSLTWLIPYRDRVSFVLSPGVHGWDRHSEVQLRAYKHNSPGVYIEEPRSELKMDNRTSMDITAT